MTSLASRNYVAKFVPWLALTWAWCISIAPVEARTVGGDVSAIKTVTAALTGLLDARLALEVWRLEKLNLLASHDHACWREVAEQQLLVETLQIHRRAAEDFAAFVQELGERIPGTSDSHWFPGSARELTIPPALPAQERGGRAASAARSQAEPGNETNARDLRLAVLQLSLTQAEVDFAHVLLPLRAGTVRPTALPVAATLQFAATAAKAIGALRVAEVALEREQLLLDSLQKLHAKGCASAEEVADARESVLRARSRLEDVSAQRERLNRVHEQLALQYSGSAADNDEIRWQSLPGSFFKDSTAINRLVALRLSRCMAAASKDAHTARLKMLISLQAKLDPVGPDSMTPTRQREFTQLDIEGNRAAALAASERAELLGLQEACLVAQVFEPRNLASAITLCDLAPSRNELTAADFVRLAGYDGESPFNAIPSMPSPAKNPVRSTGLPESPATAPFASSKDLLGGPSRRGRRLVLSTPTSQFDFPSYAEYYQNGILRADGPALQPRATAYGGPWFFPGAPTNFR